LHISAKLQGGICKTSCSLTEKFDGWGKLINIVQFQESNWCFVNFRELIDETYNFKGIIVYLLIIHIVGLYFNLIYLSIKTINYSLSLLVSIKKNSNCNIKFIEICIIFTYSPLQLFFFSCLTHDFLVASIYIFTLTIIDIDWYRMNVRESLCFLMVN